MENLIKHFERIEDYRNGFNLQHKLSDILTIAISAILSGMTTWDDIEIYGKERIDWLKKLSRITRWHSLS